MKLKIFLITALLFISSISHSHTPDVAFTEREDVKTFVQEMVKKHHFDAKTINGWLNSATLQPSIIAAMNKPAEKLPWYKYEQIFLTPKRINEGVEFWKANENTLKQAELKYGVPPEMILAIMGVETFYGKNTGNYRVLDSLVTLGFNYPPRSKFFLSELEEFFVLAREEGWDPTQIKGSYAGAMGKGQFISSSYRRYAVDFNGNGKRDLLQSNEDAIGSVANYFHVHGWQKDTPIVLAAQIKGNDYKKLVASKANPKPEHSLQDLAKVNVVPKDKPKSAWRTQPFALVMLEGSNGPEYWLGGQNFYVITRYNHSDHYAMAVYNLSQQIKEAYAANS